MKGAELGTRATGWDELHGRSSDAISALNRANQVSQYATISFRSLIRKSARKVSHSRQFLTSVLIRSFFTVIRSPRNSRDAFN